MTGVITMREKEIAYCIPSILVLVAALNEEKGLKLTLGELEKYVNAKRLLVVDGKSSDQTVKVPRVLVLKLYLKRAKARVMP